jgi:FkbM family methyltransferase
MKNSVDFLKQTLKSPTLFRWTNLSYAQEGEDMILARYFNEKKKGFYVDVGAYHPVKYSNTYYFYKRDWRGVNIDARPGSMVLFNKLRPEDKNIETAISDKNDELTYYMFDEPALNGFLIDPSLITKDGYKLLGGVKVGTKTLSEILHKHITTAQNIDFMSIDVEGLDLNVLHSHDWDAWKPEVILIEDRIFLPEKISDSATYTFLKSLGYNFFAKTVNTVFFKRQIN